MRDTDILDEARDHLVECCLEALRRGLTREDAEREAIERFGSADVVAAHVGVKRAGASRYNSGASP